MGIIFGKFRKKKTTYEALESLEKEIKSIEEFRRSTEQFHKKIVGRFVLLSVILYLISAFIFYFYFFPASLYERLYYIIPLILAPVIIISVKRVLTWYYNRKISKKQNKLFSLREEKRKMLERVMDTETYKVAKTILEKFAPEQIRKNNAITGSEMTPYKTRFPSVSGTPPQGLRQRPIPTPQPSKTSVMVSTVTPANKPVIPSVSSVAVRPSLTVHGTAQAVTPASRGIPGGSLPLPRAILPRERSVLDKMVEYLVGDGPSNRYALICSQCFSHNGMALREEFEYLSFRCCYCYTFNPSRKKRPAAPKLEFSSKASLPTQKFSDTSDSEKNSRSDTDSESANEYVPKIRDINGKTSDAEKSDFDKLSDFELKMSDVENAPVFEKECIKDDIEQESVKQTELEPEIAADQISDDKVVDNNISSVEDAADQKNIDGKTDQTPFEEVTEKKFDEQIDLKD